MNWSWASYRNLFRQGNLQNSGGPSGWSKYENKSCLQGVTLFRQPTAPDRFDLELEPLPGFTLTTNSKADLIKFSGMTDAGFRMLSDLCMRNTNPSAYHLVERKDLIFGVDTFPDWFYGASRKVFFWRAAWRAHSRISRKFVWAKKKYFLTVAMPGAS